MRRGICKGGKQEEEKEGLGEILKRGRIKKEILQRTIRGRKKGGGISLKTQGKNQVW